MAEAAESPEPTEMEKRLAAVVVRRRRRVPPKMDSSAPHLQRAIRRRPKPPRKSRCALARGPVLAKGLWCEITVLPIRAAYVGRRRGGRRGEGATGRTRGARQVQLWRRGPRGCGEERHAAPTVAGARRPQRVAAPPQRVAAPPQRFAAPPQHVAAPPQRFAVRLGLWPTAPRQRSTEEEGLVPAVRLLGGWLFGCTTARRGRQAPPARRRLVVGRRPFAEAVDVVEAPAQAVAVLVFGRRQRPQRAAGEEERRGARRDRGAVRGCVGDSGGATRTVTGAASEARVRPGRCHRTRETMKWAPRECRPRPRVAQPELEKEQPLPPAWAATWDTTHTCCYYYNTETSETTWERPVAAAAPPA
ncbi:hypothetical protein M885DRAFT_318222 [Pelagophyceae sp. CCMP2097]|nr:hypothetical protein M885DRAFT_318222 [Pelagophyceae sp. CCMP2097]